MKVKTREELLELDEELNLFEESDWNFLNADSGSNLEYFNDIRDDDFKKRTYKDVIKYAVITLCACCIFLVSGVWLYSATVGRHVITDGDASSVADREVKLERVADGVPASNEDFVEISKVTTSYFNIMKLGASFDSLNEYCLTSSTFFTTEKAYREKMEYSYDSNDCYARALRCFGQYFSISKINEVLVKDDTYYVYANLNYPDDDDLTEYFYIYANDMTKYFTSNDITEQNIVKYIIQLSDTYGLPSSEKEIVFKMCKSDSGNFVILDDSFVTNDCTTAYNHAISQAVRVLGASKGTEQYE